MGSEKSALYGFCVILWVEGVGSEKITLCGCTVFNVDFRGEIIQEVAISNIVRNLIR